MQRRESCGSGGYSSYGEVRRAYDDSVGRRFQKIISRLVNVRYLDARRGATVRVHELARSSRSSQNDVRITHGSESRGRARGGGRADLLDFRRSAPRDRVHQLLSSSPTWTSANMPWTK